jgi:hypothetical protein
LGSQPCRISDYTTTVVWNGQSPAEIQLEMIVFVYNSGARGAALTQVVVSYLSEDGGPRLFSLLSGTPMLAAGYALIPEAFESGDVKLLRVLLKLHFVARVASAAELVQRLEGKSRLTLRISCRYLKGRSLLPWKWRDPIVETSYGDVDVLLGPLRDKAVSQARR